MRTYLIGLATTSLSMSGTIAGAAIPAGTKGSGRLRNPPARFLRSTSKDLDFGRLRISFERKTMVGLHYRNFPTKPIHLLWARGGLGAVWQWRVLVLLLAVASLFLHVLFRHQVRQPLGVLLS
jgi:hypothetical protein